MCNDFTCYNVIQILAFIYEGKNSSCSKLSLSLSGEGERDPAGTARERTPTLSLPQRASQSPFKANQHHHYLRAAPCPVSLSKLSPCARLLHGATTPHRPLSSNTHTHTHYYTLYTITIHTRLSFTFQQCCLRVSALINTRHTVSCINESI